MKRRNNVSMSLWIWLALGVLVVSCGGGGGGGGGSKAWGTAALIETDNAGPAYDPQIAFDANGNALAVWEQFDGTRSNIVANRFQ